MSKLLSDPIVVSRLERDPQRFVFSVDISNVPLHKRLKRIAEWQRFFETYNEVERQKNEI